LGAEEDVADRKAGAQIKVPLRALTREADGRCRYPLPRDVGFPLEEQGSPYNSTNSPFRRAFAAAGATSDSRDEARFSMPGLHAIFIQWLVGRERPPGRTFKTAEEKLTVRLASTAIRFICVIAPLLALSGCSSFGGSSSGSSKEDQALAAAQNALQEAKAARASADAALQEARANRIKMDELMAAVRGGGGSPDAVQQALEQARAANQAAQEAKAMAQQAQDASQRSSARADRMFQKAMRK
jgi:murein lipoprotein